MSKMKIVQNSNLSFSGCDGCGATCCQSTIIYASLYDVASVSKYFPIFFLIKNSKISLVYFFYYGEKDKEHCPYLKNDLCSIYEQRPYACRSYPFSNIKNDFYNDSNCPNIVKNEFGMKLADSKRVNPKILKDFIGEDFLSKKESIIEISEEFVKFCNKNDLLIPYEKHYANNEIYMNFKPSMQKNLYLIHPFKIAALRLNKQKLFDGKEYFLSIIQELIKTQTNVKELLKSKEKLQV